MPSAVVPPDPSACGMQVTRHLTRTPDRTAALDVLFVVRQKVGVAGRDQPERFLIPAWSLGAIS